MSENKRSKITPENLEEAARLRELWGKQPHRKQAEFGEYYGLGNQANVGHYLNGRNALNPKAAAAFAAELKCNVSDFSPRVAAQIDTLAKLTEPLRFKTPEDRTEHEKRLKALAYEKNHVIGPLKDLAAAISQMARSSRQGLVPLLTALALAPDSREVLESISSYIEKAPLNAGEGSITIPGIDHIVIRNGKIEEASEEIKQQRPAKRLRTRSA